MGKNNTGGLATASMPAAFGGLPPVVFKRSKAFPKGRDMDHEYRLVPKSDWTIYAGAPAEAQAWMYPHWNHEFSESIRLFVENSVRCFGGIPQSDGTVIVPEFSGDHVRTAIGWAFYTYAFIRAFDRARGELVESWLDRGLRVDGGIISKSDLLEFCGDNDIWLDSTQLIRWICERLLFGANSLRFMLAMIADRKPLSPESVEDVLSGLNESQIDFGVPAASHVEAVFRMAEGRLQSAGYPMALAAFYDVDPIPNWKRLGFDVPVPDPEPPFRKPPGYRAILCGWGQPKARDGKSVADHGTLLLGLKRERLAWEKLRPWNSADQSETEREEFMAKLPEVLQKIRAIAATAEQIAPALYDGHREAAQLRNDLSDILVDPESPITVYVDGPPGEQRAQLLDLRASLGRLYKALKESNPEACRRNAGAVASSVDRLSPPEAAKQNAPRTYSKGEKIPAAIAMLLQDPIPSNEAIAKAVDCNVKSLSNSRRFRLARLAALKANALKIRRGSKENGNLEAIDDED